MSTSVATRRYLAALASLPLAGCVTAGQVIANLPVQFHDDQIRHELRYGEKEWQRMDIYYPEKTSQAPLPVIVFFHGGRWSTGSKSHYPFIAETLTKRGYAVAIPDYAKYPQVTFPAFMDDAAKAIAWLHKQAQPLQLDRYQMFVMGHSSGAHIGALLCADPRYLRAQGGSRNWIAGFAGLAGPYAFTPDEPDLVAIFGPPENFAQMQVPKFIDGRQPPMLLLHGTDDDAVSMSNLKKLERAIRDKGGMMRTRIYYGVGHIGILTPFTWVQRERTDIVDDIDQFFHEQGQAEHIKPVVKRQLQPAA